MSDKVTQKDIARRNGRMLCALLAVLLVLFYPQRVIVVFGEGLLLWNALDLFPFRRMLEDKGIELRSDNPR